ncbi:hypothetical protein PRBEI_2000449700 [Prionailurus iriomotensis]
MCKFFQNGIIGSKPMNELKAFEKYFQIDFKMSQPVSFYSEVCWDFYCYYEESMDQFSEN